MVRKITVCDDEAESRRQISLCLSRLEQESGDTFEITFFNSGEELMQGILPDTQVLLLDIQMGKVSGMDAARKLRARGFDAHIIFITSKVEYALEGYEVHAYAFLRKPVQYAAVQRHLSELFKQTDEKAHARITVNGTSGTDIIDCTQLVYVEVYRHDCTFAFDDEKRVYPVTLAEIETATQPYGFFRCHKSYLVNFEKITHIGAENITVSTGALLPLSKHRKKEFMEAYAGFMGARL